MASSDGIHNNALIVNTIDGLTSIDATSVLIDNVPIVPGSFVPYTGADNPVNLGNQRIFTTYVPTNQFDLVPLGTLTTQYVPYTGANTNLDMGLFRIRTAFTPVASPDVLNLGYSAANLVPYTGANAAINLNNKQIRTSYAPTIGDDLINKTYADATYPLATAVVPYTGATTTVNLGAQNIKSTFTPVVGADLLNKTYGDATYVSSAAGYALLSAGTLASPQTFTGYNNIGGFIFTTTPQPGAASFYLGRNSVGEVILTSPIPQQQLNSSSVTYYLVGNISSVNLDPFVPYINGGVSVTVNGSGVATKLTVPGLTFSGAPSAGSSTTILALDGANNVITTTAATVVLQTKPTTATTIYLAGNISNTNAIAFAPYLTAGCYLTTDATGAITALDIPGLTLESGRVKANAVDLFLTTSAQANFLYLRNAVSGLKMETTGVSPNLSTLLSTELTDATLTLISGKTFYLSSFQSGIQYQARTVGHTFTMGAPQVTYATITTGGLSTNAVTSFASNQLNLNGTNGLVTIQSTGTTIVTVGGAGLTLTGVLNVTGVSTLIGALNVTGTTTLTGLLNVNAGNVFLQSFMNRSSAGTGFAVAHSYKLNTQEYARSGGGINASGNPLYGAWWADALNSYSFGSDTAMTSSLLYADWYNGLQVNVNGNKFGAGAVTNLSPVGMCSQNSAGWIGGAFGGNGHPDRIVVGGLGGVGPTVGAHNNLLNAWATMAVAYPVTVFPSDEKIKEDIIDANHSICYDTIKKIRLVRFKYKIGGQGEGFIGRDRNLTGVLAQEFERIFPKSVTDMPTPDEKDTIKSINLDQMNYTLLGAVKELMNITENQQKTINQLIEHVSTLTNAFNELKKNSL